MTLLGLVFAALYAGSTFWGRRGLASVMVVSAAFPDSAAVNVGPASVSPFYLGSIALAVWSALEWALRRRRPARFLSLELLLAYAVLVTAVAPLVLRGLPVVASGTGLDQQVDNLSALAPSVSNLAQVAYLALNVSFILFSVRDRLVTRGAVTTMFAVGIGTALFVWILERTGSSLGSTLFHNSDRGFYTTEIERLSGQFSEPSHLGAFAVMSLLYFLTLALMTPSWRRCLASLAGVAASAICIVLSPSGTGLAAIAIVAVVVSLMGGWNLLRHRFAVSIRLRWVLATAASLPFMLSFGILYAISTYQRLNEVKDATSSSENRAFADWEGIRVLADSFGLGVGLGSNRTSSILPLLLSTIGIVGTTLAVISVVVCIRRGWRNRHARPGAVALAGFCAAAVVSFADLANPAVWVLMAFLAAFVQPDTEDGQNAEQRDDGSRETVTTRSA